LRINVIEQLCRVLQVTTDILSLSNDTGGGGTPFLEYLLEALAAHTLPVALDLADSVLNLPLELIDLFIALNENRAEPTQ